MSCDRRCFDEKSQHFGHDECGTCPGRDDGRKRDPVLPKPCNCMTRVRMGMFVKIEGREYPAPHHFEDCALHVKERYVRLDLDGSWCVMTPAEADEYVSQSGREYTREDIYLTADQFNNMPEFQGF